MDDNFADPDVSTTGGRLGYGSRYDYTRGKQRWLNSAVQPVGRSRMIRRSHIGKTSQLVSIVTISIYAWANSEFCEWIFTDHDNYGNTCSCMALCYKQRLKKQFKIVAIIQVSCNDHIHWWKIAKRKKEKAKRKCFYWWQPAQLKYNLQILGNPWLFMGDFFDPNLPNSKKKKKNKFTDGNLPN